MTGDITLTCNSVGSWHVVHARSGTAVDTEPPPRHGGGGESFSATDLLAAALGVCIGTDLDIEATRHSIPTDALRIRVSKTLASDPKRLSALDVHVMIAADVSDETLTRLRHVASRSLVQRSLDTSVAVNIAFDGRSRPENEHRDALAP